MAGSLPSTAPEDETPKREGAAAVWDESRNLEWESTIRSFEPLKPSPAMYFNQPVQIVERGREGEKPDWLELLLPLTLSPPHPLEPCTANLQESIPFHGCTQTRLDETTSSDLPVLE